MIIISICCIFLILSPVTCQNNLSALQSVLNQICSRDPSRCGISTPPTTSPTLPPPERCHDCPAVDLCVPETVACSQLHSDVKCRAPSGIGVHVQSLICGDGEVKSTCGFDSFYPVMTEIIVQCQDTNEIDSQLKRGVDGFGIIDDDGNGSGAGIYRCFSNGQWVPVLGSPNLNSLISSCYRAGCGRLPLPSSRTKIDRPWSWVRGLYKLDEFWCTATLISPSIAITAAHCVTERQSVELITDWPHQLKLKLPAQETTMCNIVIHPNYIPGRQPIFDIALLKFEDALPVPYACIVKRKLNSKGVLFELKRNGRDEWTTASARIDSNCIPSNSNNVPSQCDVQKRFVPYGQFCLTEHSLSPPPGSSGGPFLMPLNHRLEDVYAIAGVLSYSTNETSCLPDHYIYTDVAEENVNQWIQSHILNLNAC